MCVCVRPSMWTFFSRTGFTTLLLMRTAPVLQYRTLLPDFRFTWTITWFHFTTSLIITINSLSWNLDLTIQFLKTTKDSCQDCFTGQISGVTVSGVEQGLFIEAIYITFFQYKMAESKPLCFNCFKINTF